MALRDNGFATRASVWCKSDARRPSESTKMEDFGGRIWRQHPKQTHGKLVQITEAKHDSKMEPNRRPNGAKMDPKRHPKSDVFLDGFPDAFGNIDGIAGEPRVSLD